MQLLNLNPITTAQSAQLSSTFQLRSGRPGGQFGPMFVQASFLIGTGGTSVDAWLQTGVDGTNWCDVANFHFVNTPGFRFYNLAASAINAIGTPTDGTLAANTSTAGIFANFWRVKYTTVGTYSGGTSLRIDAACSGLTTLLT